jgi:hypothetical protein
VIDDAARIFRSGVEDTAGGRVALVREPLVGYALLHVVGFGGEDQQGLGGKSADH